MLERQGNYPAARDAFQRALDSGHAEHAPRAAARLGLQVERQRDLAGACVLYRRALDFGSDTGSAWTARSLGMLLAEQGDAAGARAAFELAIKCQWGRDVDVAPDVARWVARLYRRRWPRLRRLEHVLRRRAAFTRRLAAPARRHTPQVLKRKWPWVRRTLADFIRGK